MGVLFIFLKAFYSGSTKTVFQNIVWDVLNKQGRIFYLFAQF